MTPDELLAAWHEQQTAFIEFRGLRTRMITDALVALRAELGRPLRLLDLACGPASLASAALEALPDGEAVAVDCDPVLLRLARETNRFGDRLRLVEADLVDPDLVAVLPPARTTRRSARRPCTGSIPTRWWRSTSGCPACSGPAPCSSTPITWATTGCGTPG